MEAGELDSRMRALERFRDLRIGPDAWTVLRLDGRAFTHFTQGRFAKPFDTRLRDLMVTSARTLVEDFQGLYACTHSDEISVLFQPGWRLFDGRVEKLVSVSAGVVSAAFTLACGNAACFDSRIWQGENEADVCAYFRWRQQDAARCALHAWCYWHLREQGLSVEEAVGRLAGLNSDGQKRLLAEMGIDPDRLPLWQRRGVGLHWESIEKPGYDPLRDIEVTARRRRIRVEMEPPAGEAYVRWLSGHLAAAKRQEHD